MVVHYYSPLLKYSSISAIQAAFAYYSTDLSNIASETLLIFGPQIESHTQHFTHFDDAIVEENETLVIFLSSPEVRVTVLTPKTAIVFVDDDGELL